MCDPGIKIKLCTCDLSEIDQSNCWQLKSGATLLMVVGDFMPPEGGFVAFDTKSFIKQKIIDDLNDGGVFDFEYIPSNGDTLKIWIDGDEYHFIYRYEEFCDASGEDLETEGEIKSFGAVKMTNPW